MYVCMRIQIYDLIRYNNESLDLRWTMQSWVYQIKELVSREATLRVLRLERRALSFTDVGTQPQSVSGFRV